MKIRVLVLVLALLLPTLHVAAQTSRGTVGGVVTVPAGAVIRSATVTLTNTQTNVSRETTANDEGSTASTSSNSGPTPSSSAPPASAS